MRSDAWIPRAPIRVSEGGSGPSFGNRHYIVTGSSEERKKRSLASRATQRSLPVADAAARPGSTGFQIDVRAWLQ